MKLQGRTALVTGAGRGIGRSYALRLAELGADVAVLDFDLKSYEAFELEKSSMQGDSTAAEIQTLGRKSLAIEADVTKPEAMQAAVDEILNAWGRLDIAVCNAGGGIGAISETKATEVADDVLDGVLQRNLYGTIYTCKAAAAPMKKQRSGRLITVSSQAGRRADRTGGYAHYGAAKAGIAMYTRYLAQEVGPYGITANCIAPGYIGTGRLMPLFDTIGGEQLTDSVALRRLGTPEDCAGVVEFLATDLGAYVTGTVIPVDGGSTL
ncbi:SDR family oxidoreductase [Georgenia sp. EYE_87]|uniref:SDR family NAD(P)-dependent oxidoreductase n=1 Tax=Georgenia sp. EYE_87 TaxID=2853448 RepID=UPI0020056EE2|nr:SDR family NAD(P)-dependent oxidoreductase [Georgenia sp. EYE_87]MCK6210061.1 SDR family oxidoreductase [Georgenia sp. EYE_87]